MRSSNKIAKGKGLILFALIAIIGLAVVFVTVTKVTDLASLNSGFSRASISGGSAKLSFTKNGNAFKYDSIDPIDVQVSMVGAKNQAALAGISAYHLVLNIKNAASLTLKDTDITFPKDLFNIDNISNKKTGDVITVSYDALYVKSGTAGFQSPIQGPQTIMTLKFTSTAPSKTTDFTIEPDLTQSRMISRDASNTDLLDSAPVTAKYALYRDTTTPSIPKFSKTAPKDITVSTATFDFSSTDDVRPSPLPAGVLNYRTFLDDKWSEYSTKTSVTYNNLSRGPHKFSVQAKDDVGHESEIMPIYTFTYYDGSATLSLKLNVNGLTGERRLTNPTTVTISNTSGYKKVYEDVAMKYVLDSKNSYYTLSVPLPSDISTGYTSYTVSVKPKMYLQKKFVTQLAKGIPASIDMSTSKNLADMIQPADFNGDNQLDLMDFTAFLSRWTSTNVQASEGSELANYDLNGDSLLNMLDITLMKNAWKSSVVKGE